LKKLLAFIAILAGAAGALYCGWLVWFLYMMSNWSHVSSLGEGWVYVAAAAGFFASLAAVWFGAKTFRDR
jgi:hypothetical protein